MNDLRIILLVIGIALIALIYIWESLKQKRNLRSRIDTYHAADRNPPRLTPVAHADVDTDQVPADFNLFLHQDKTPSKRQLDIGTESLPDVDADPELWDITKTEKEAAPGMDGAQEIMVIYITVDKQPCFTGPDILKAAAAAEMKYGDMKIFHYHGPDRKHAQRPLFSLANISEPGYFVMEDMQGFTTKGLALFMCLPAEMGGDIAFEFMLDAANSLAGTLGGSLRGADRKQLDEEAIDKMRAIANLY